MDGILIIDKPAGITSHDVVARLRRILKTKKIGHTGTLDPFATGVVVALVGKATRLAQFLDKDEKEYEAIVRFGFETDTGDLTGKSKVRSPQSAIGSLEELSIEKIQNILPEFLGEILQTPPMYSAKKIEGKKLYELARKGIEIERKPVSVKIYELEITNDELQKSKTDSELPTADCGLRVVCSAGTYIRTLAEDIGRKLDTGAHLAALRRMRAGKFSIEKAVGLEELEKVAVENKLAEILVSMNEAVSHLAEIVLSGSEIEKLKNGIGVMRNFDKVQENQPFRMTDGKNNLLAIGYYDSQKNLIQPRIVLL